MDVEIEGERQDEKWCSTRRKEGKKRKTMGEEDDVEERKMKSLQRQDNCSVEFEGCQATVLGPTLALRYHHLVLSTPFGCVPFGVGWSGVV